MNNKTDKSWIKNSSNMIVVYSIFAAIAGLLLVYVLQDGGKAINENWKWPVSLFAFSFFLFSLTAERIAEAVSEQNLQKRIAYMLLYNFGIIFLFLGGALAIRVDFLPIIVKVLLYIPLLLQSLLLITITIFIYIKWYRWFWVYLLIVLLVLLVSIFYQNSAWWLPAALLSIPWLDDARWLIFSDNDEFKEYFKIVDNITSSPDERIWVKIFYKLRNIVNCLLYKGHKNESAA